MALNELDEPVYSVTAVVNNDGVPSSYEWWKRLRLIIQNHITARKPHQVYLVKMVYCLGKGCRIDILVTGTKGTICRYINYKKIFNKKENRTNISK